MKSKTFEFDEDLAKQFERFCAQRMLTERRIAAATIMYWMELTAAERERVLLRFDAYKAGQRSLVIEDQNEPLEEIAVLRARIAELELLSPGVAGKITRTPGGGGAGQHRGAAKLAGETGHGQPIKPEDRPKK